MVEEQQRKADAALAAGRGLAEDDPERETHRTTSPAGRQRTVRPGVQLRRPDQRRLRTSSCRSRPARSFWEAFKWLAIILIIPALIFGGPIALLALGVNLALFIKTIVDVANGDASFLDLFLAGLGLIAPTTKALPIFSILKGIAKGIGAGIKGIANTFKSVFSKDFLFNGLLAGLKAMPMLANLAIRETGLFVISNIRNFVIGAGNFVNNFGKISIGAFNKFTLAFTQVPATIGKGFANLGKGFSSLWTGGREFLSAHFGGLQWTRIFLPVAADEIRAFKAMGMSNFQAFTQALKVGVIGRGVLAQNVFGLPTISAIGRGIGAIPIDTSAAASVGKGGFLSQLMTPEVRIPSVHINNLGMATGSGFTAGHAFTAIDDLHLAPMNNLGTGNVGISVHTPTTVTTGGVHVPATAGVNGLTTNMPSLPVNGTSVGHVAGGVTVSPPSVANLGSLHVASPQASISDLVGGALRNNTPTVSPHFATSIGEGTSHGFAANQMRLSIDEIVNLPAPSAHGTTHAVTPPTVDRVNAALDLLNGGPADLKVGAPGNLRVDTPSLAGTQNTVSPPGVHVQPVTVPRSDVPIQPNTVHSFSPGKTDIPLTGLPDHPGAVVKVERLEGGMTTFNLHGGGPNGRVDPLSGGSIRFTDTASGTTTRFDSNGVVLDQGVRLTKADGLPRIDDRVLIHRPDGDFRITTLDGNVVPDQLTVRPLDSGGVQVLGNDGANWHYNAQGKLENQSVTAAWNADLAAKAGVFRKPGDTDAVVNATMDDFAPVQRAQNNLDIAHENVAVHGQRVDGPSSGPSVGEQVHIDLHAAEHDLAAAKNAFEGKHGLSADGVQNQLDNLLADSLKERPRLPGGGGRMYDLPGNSGVHFEISGSNVTMHGVGAESFEASVAGRTLTITRGGDHSWTYSLGFGGRANQIGESFPLNGGLFDGQPVALEGRLGSLDTGLVDTGVGGKWPVKVTDDGLVVVSPQGPLHYDRSGAFHGIGPSETGHLPTPVAPPHLTGADATRWNAQVDLSRTHLTAAASNKAVENLMKDVMGGAFTSKRGFEGYVNPTALADGTLVGKVKNFDTITKDLLFKGPADNVTVYRGVSMDPLSAQADSFVERLPISTSSTMKFQDEWAKNGVNSNRVVFEIDVPPAHGKLAMSYPDGYHWEGQAKPWNQDQWEVTLSPANLVRTGPDRFEGDLRIIPVKAEQIPAARFDEVITAKWPGMSSESAFGDFAKSFELANLQKFEGLEDIATRTTTSVDGLSLTIHVSKPGFGDELTITVLRNPQADSVRVIWTADGVNQFDKVWSGQQFANLATDLRGNVLHNNDQFLSMPKPAQWEQTAGKGKQLSTAWEDDFAARAAVFRAPGDTTGSALSAAAPPPIVVNTVHVPPVRQALTGPGQARGTWFAEGDAAGGVRLVDVQGTPIPNTRAELLPNGQIRVSGDGIDGLRWYGRDGSQTATAIRVHDPGNPGQAFLYRGRDLVLMDAGGNRLPGTVTAVDGGGFRITDAGGVGRTFDHTGQYLDVHVPLGGPNSRQFVVHDVHGNVALYGSYGTVEHVQGVGYRVVDHGNYHVYDDTGVVQAHGHRVTLPGETGFLEITANGARRLDNNFQPIPGRTVTFNPAGEITVTRAGGHDVFDLQGGVIREVTDLDGHAIGVDVSRVTRDRNGITLTDHHGTRVPTPHRVRIDPNDGGVRVEVHVPGSPRNGEFHVFSRDGHLTEQGFPVVRGGRPTEFTYVVNRTDNTWRRIEGTNVDGPGAFHRGKVELSGAENGRIKLMSSTGKPVEVFERRWLPDGSVLDSFRRTDTLGFGRFDRSTGWVSYQGGARTDWGTRHFDTAGTGWRDVNHSYQTIREYRDGLQKYHTGTGHVLATKQADGSWQWHRYDDHASVIAQGNRSLERIGDGWTDTFTRTVGTRTETVVAQQKWGSWHLPETAGQYREYTMTRAADGTVTRAETWLQHARQGKDSGSAVNIGTELLTVIRQGEQRPPVWIRDGRLFDNPRPGGSVAHLADDNRFQIFSWSKGNQHGTRYVGMDGAAVDIDAHGNFVRSSGTLGDGTKIKVGDLAGQPAVPHPSGGGVPWEAGANRGWRLTNGQGWEDVQHLNGNWVVVRESRPGGVVREYTDPAIRTVWTERDAHGNLTGLSHQSPDRAGIFIEGTGASDSARWTWREVDLNGTAIGGRGGERQYFRGSTDDSLSWDDSFRDFDAAGNLVRDRRMLDGGRYVESWWTANGWRSGEFDKFGNQAAGSVHLERVWSTGDGGWQADWVRGAAYSRDQVPGSTVVVRETPLHVTDGPIRIREYHLDNGITQYGRWKEFDHGTVVRDRQPSGNNFLETDAWRGQWKLYDRNGNLLGERSDNGLVFELRDNRLHLTGNEYDFRGALTELRGWGRRVREAQRMPWLNNTEWTVHGTTITPPGGAAFSEARYAPYWKVVAQKALLEFAQDFVLEFAANLIVNAIVSAAQNKPFTGKDALKSLMNAAVSSTIKTGIGTAVTETKLGGSLRNLKLGLTNVDSGKHWNRRPLNHDKSWSNEWGGNEGPTRWRGGTFDFGFNLGPSVLAGFVNGAMNAAIFGVSNADGTTVKLTGWEAIGDGGINAVASLTSGVSTALVKNLATGIGGTRYFHRQGFGDFWLQLPFRVFEKSIQSVFLTSAYRASINPSWYQSPTSPLVLPGSVTVPPEITASGLWVPPGSEGAQSQGAQSQGAQSQGAQ